jgi:hypothetical protein
MLYKRGATISAAEGGSRDADFGHALRNPASGGQSRQFVIQERGGKRERRRRRSCKRPRSGSNSAFFSSPVSCNVALFVSLRLTIGSHVKPKELCDSHKFVSLKETKSATLQDTGEEAEIGIEQCVFLLPRVLQRCALCFFETDEFMRITQSTLGLPDPESRMLGCVPFDARHLYKPVDWIARQA